MSNFKSRYGQVAIVLGGQWGDEGKGKLVDILSAEYDMVGRATGGANAGHTIYFKNPAKNDEVTKMVFHLIPAGIIHEKTRCVIGNGVVVHIPTMFAELKQLEELGINVGERLMLSERAHIVFNYHQYLDGLQEDRKGDNKVGTTKRGIGPCYTDKIARHGLRMVDLKNWDEFEKKYHANLQNIIDLYGAMEYDSQAELNEIKQYRERLLNMLSDTALFLNNALASEKSLVMEGANAVGLDIDHGTYPYVTSSNPSVGGIFTGSGIAPTKVSSVIGIMKAYTTRVGSGAFPSELNNDLGDYIRNKGGEFGSTTGRPRRCGWFDAVVGRYSVMINGLTHVNLTKLDVLTGLETIKIAVAYNHGNDKYEKTLPALNHIMEEAEVEYVELPGWQEDISTCSKFDDLPENARKYVHTLEELLGCPIDTIGVGQRRDQLLVRDHWMR